MYNLCTTEKTINLLDVLINPSKFEWKNAIYSKDKQPFTKDTLCIMLNPDIIDSEDTKLDVHYLLSVQAIQGIISNLEQQTTNPTDDERLDAFNYYMKNDAFIEL